MAGLGDGDVALLENLRFEAARPARTTPSAARWPRGSPRLADLFVSDGFGVVHRKQASVYDVPAAAARGRRPGPAEVAVFARGCERPDRPYVVVLGGSKVSDKLGVIGNLLGQVDRLLVGGGMCFTFLAAQGHGVGDSLLEADQVDDLRGGSWPRPPRAGSSVLPVDVVVAGAFSADAETEVGRRGRHRGRLAGPGHRPAHRRAVRRRSWPTRAPWSGTVRWASSRWRRSPTGTRAVAEAIIERRRDDRGGRR